MTRPYLRHYCNFMLLVALAACPQAYGQSRQSPITIDADRVAFEAKKDIRIFEGNVVVVQGSTKLHADRVELRQTDSEIKLLTAEGSPVEFWAQANETAENIEAKADKVVVDYDTSKARLTGAVRLTRGRAQIDAPVVLYDMESGTMVTQSSSAESGERTRVVIDENQ